MSGHIMAGGVFISGSDNVSSRIDQLEVDLTSIEDEVEFSNETVRLLTDQQTINTSNINMTAQAVATVDAQVTLNTPAINTNIQAIAGLNSQQTINTSNINTTAQTVATVDGQVALNTTAIGPPSGPGMLYNINQNDIGLQFIRMDVATNTSNISAVSTKANNNEYVINELDTVFVEKDSGGVPQTVAGDLTISNRLTTAVWGNEKLGRICVGSSTPQGTYTHVVNGWNIDDFAKTNFIGSSANTSSSESQFISFCNLNRNAANNAYGPATTFAAFSNNGGNSDLNHIAALTCKQRSVNNTTHMEGDLAFFTKSGTQSLNLALTLQSDKGAVFQSFVAAPQYVTASDDRLKENEELIVNACDTLSKLRPQIYDKKSSLDDNLDVSWLKESGLIAQEVYYDAPELRHLIKLDEDLKSPDDIDIPMDPQEDPDYSVWPEKPAHINYIGLIAYLIKANNELNDRVKALEMWKS